MLADVALAVAEQEEGVYFLGQDESSAVGVSASVHGVEEA